MRAFAAEHAKAKRSTFDTLSVPDAQTTHAFTLFLTPFLSHSSFDTFARVVSTAGRRGQSGRFNPVQFCVVFILASVTFTQKCPNLEPFPDLVGMNRRRAPQHTYCMEFSMRVMVRKAARLAVYEEMTMRANIHQTPIIIRVARVVYGTSPPGKQKTATRNRRSMHSNRK